MKKSYILYTVLFFAVCLIPVIGMAFPEEETSTENRTLASAPALKDEDGWNVTFLSDAGDWFTDHFGFRQELVTANALVEGKLFGVSAADSVIQGTDGWLYYTDSLSDYLGTELMSDRALFNVAHTLSMTQTYVQRKGASFLFTVAPNKNSLYGENMPYYYQLKASDEKNLENLKPVLESEGVNYVDLYELLSSQDEVLYHKRDSHWNNKGAALAADTLLNTLGKDHLTLTEAPSETRVDYIGDLDGMLYPLAETPEEEIYYEGLEGFSYVEEVESNFDPRITTVNPTSSGSLVMFRDSFGNALLPFLAQNFANAYFTRGIPYQMTELDTHEADTVIVERAERFLPEMAENPPQMEGVLMLPEGEIQEEEGTVENLQGEVTGETVKISGVIEEALLEDDSLICIRVNGNAYEAFPATIQVDGTKRDSGFVLYLSENWQEGAEEIEVLVQRGDEWYKIYSGTL